MVEIKVPTLGESVTEATVAKWHKKLGDLIKNGELLVELETDKVTLEVTAPADGQLTEIAAKTGDTVAKGALLGQMQPGVVEVVDQSVDISDIRERSDSTTTSAAPTGGGQLVGDKTSGAMPSNGDITKSLAPNDAQIDLAYPSSLNGKNFPSPSARRVIEEHNLDFSHIKGTGKDGRITKDDAVIAIAKQKDRLKDEEGAGSGGGEICGNGDNGIQSGVQQDGQSFSIASGAANLVDRDAIMDIVTTATSGVTAVSRPAETRVKMTRLRKTIAQRLKNSQNTAAILATFNEVDMFEVLKLRQTNQEIFQKKHEVKLGFMSFFVRATINALGEFPIVNASIDGDDIVYRNYYNIGVAVGTENGLVVPVLKNAEIMSLAQIETQIANLGKKARENKITMDDMSGGSFSITNGGTYGSMLSTPIINPPQSAILGMHNIVQRPVVLANGEIVARPIMFVALSYDHRLIDGREAVQFLVRIKEQVERPERMLLGI